MSFELYQDVILTVDLPEEGLRAGDVGALVERHVVPGKAEGYSVEFFDMTGRTVAAVTLPASQLRADGSGSAEHSDAFPDLRLNRPMTPVSVN